MMEEIDRFQVPPVNSEMQPLDPSETSTLEADSESRGPESVPINYKPSPLQVKIEKQRELARKGSAKNGTAGSPVNQQPKKNVMARTRSAEAQEQKVRTLMKGREKTSHRTPTGIRRNENTVTGVGQQISLLRESGQADRLQIRPSFCSTWRETGVQTFSCRLFLTFLDQPTTVNFLLLVASCQVFYRLIKMCKV
ncbi:protein FAM219A isoform X1 [Tachysurus fulvidraco]|uniref:protein FAM219A isoform X1 n=1 Tax=Tachysurus fulvidraco TaxID=1234273 RepID=UPI001FF06E97|nr:protein FAM219A isoform X1 [Tachysurus fulvidraco]